MKRNVYAIFVAGGRILAAEADDRTAAALLSAGKTILILTERELNDLARRQYRRLILLPPIAARCSLGHPPRAPRRPEAAFRPVMPAAEAALELV